MEVNSYRIRNLVPTEDELNFLAIMVYVAHHPTRSPLPDAAIARHFPYVSVWVADWGRRGDMALVAEQENELIGVACYRLFSVSDQVEGFLDEQTPVILLAVHPHYRGHNVGSRLLTGLIQRAKAASFAALSLSVTTPNPAYELYERAGFHPVRVHEYTLATMRVPLEARAESDEEGKRS